MNSEKFKKEFDEIEVPSQKLNKIISEEIKGFRKRNKSTYLKNKNFYLIITAAALFITTLIFMNFNNLAGDSNEIVTPQVDSPYYTNLNELYHNSQIIVSGTMINQKRDNDSETDASYIISELSVSNVYKGDLVIESVFIRQQDPESVATDTVVVEENKEYLFFLEGEPTEQLFPISEQVFVIKDDLVSSNHGDVNFTLDEFMGLSE